MGERSEYSPGTFSWVELLTSDAAGAKAFYAALLGWDWEDVPLPEGGTYTLVLKDGKRVAGLHQPSPENAGPPAWLSYVSVEDADAAAARAGELGATRARRAVRRDGRRPDGRAPGSAGSGVRGLAGGPADRAPSS